MTATILIVEDSNFGDQLVEILEMEGFASILAMNAGEGVRLAQEHQPNLIFTDWKLPDMNGFEFIQSIHDLPALAKIPIIMISGMVEKQAKALEAGAIKFLCKPFCIAEFLESVQQHCLIGSLA